MKVYSFYGTAAHCTPAPPTPTKFPQQLVPAQREVWPQRPFILVCVPNAIRTTKPARALEVVCAYTTTYYFTGLNQARVAPVKTANGLRSLLFLF